MNMNKFIMCIYTAPLPQQDQTPPASSAAGKSSAVSLEEKRKSVLEAQKRKKEELMAKGSSGAATVEQSSGGSGSAPAAIRNSSPLKNPSSLAVCHTLQLEHFKRALLYLKKYVLFIDVPIYRSYTH